MLSGYFHNCKGLIFKVALKLKPTNKHFIEVLHYFNKPLMGNTGSASKNEIQNRPHWPSDNTISRISSHSNEFTHKITVTSQVTIQF